MIKKLYKRWLNFLIELFNFFYLPLLRSFYKKELKRLPENTSLFFLTRMDFGTYLYLTYYAKCWHELRGPTTLVIFCSKFDEASELAHLICPQTKLINPKNWVLQLALKVFGPYRLNEHCLYRLYGEFLVDYPQALRIFEPSCRAPYIPFFDRRLENTQHLPKPFVDAYKNVRKYLNYNDLVMRDAFSLHFQTNLKRQEYCLTAKHRLQRALGITEPYVVMNLNCKKYKEKAGNRKGIEHPERFNVIIDRLIERGFSVVLQGRHEQPHFKSRKGFIDYAKSSFTSIENDLALYSGAHFAIINKTGPETFCTLANVPQLGLNYTEISSLVPNTKIRFFPKHIERKGQRLSWKELLISPCYFDIGGVTYEKDLAFFDLEENELIEALEEFLPLCSAPDEKWLEYSSLQQEFRAHLHPIHLDPYEVKNVPCDAYLRLANRVHKLESVD